MARITVLELDPIGPLDRFEPWLRQAGVEVEVVAVPVAGVPTPDALGDGLVVLGGRMDAHAEAEHPWLADVKRLLAHATSAELPVLGICLGHQVLAVTLGGEVAVGHPTGHEHGPVALTWTDAAASDPVLGEASRLGCVQPLSHHDVVTTAPPGAVILARSEAVAIEAFRVGSALGVQFHPEVSPERMGLWHARTGGDEAARRAEMEAVDAEVRAVGTAVARGFARECGAS